MQGKRGAAAALALLAVMGVTAVAIAGSSGEPQVDRVEASIVFTHAEGSLRFCETPEGFFVDQRVTATGTATGDPLLTGEVRLRINSSLIELASGDGYERGTLLIRDPETGRTKAEARFDNADIDEISQGTLVGQVREPVRDLFANWRITFNDDGSITGQIGGVAPDGRLPAVVTSGQCSGAFERFEADIPPPSDDEESTSRASGGRTGWAPPR